MSSNNQNKLSQIGKLIAYTKEDTTNTYLEINFGQIPNYKAQEINAKTGVKVSGAKRRI